MPTRQTPDAMALKLSSDTILLSKVYGFKGFSNRSQINGII